MKLQAIANAFFFILMIGVNFLANRLPIGGKTTGELSDMYSSLFVPAGFSFSIRGIIYLLVGCYIGAQLRDARKEKPVGIASRVGPWFILSSLANCAWIVAWHLEQIGLSVLIMLGLLVSLILISTKYRGHNGTLYSRVSTMIPFGVYLGWISVATIANISIYLLYIQWGQWWISAEIRTMIMIGIATLLGIAQLYKNANIPFAVVLLWAFYGIATKRLTVDPLFAQNIVWAVALCSVLLAGIMGRTFEHWRRTIRSK